MISSIGCSSRFCRTPLHQVEQESRGDTGRDYQLPPPTKQLYSKVVREKQLMPRGGWRGGGRKPKPESEKYIRFQISCSPKLKEKLDRYLETQTLDRSSYISKLIEQDLARRKKNDGNK